MAIKIYLPGEERLFPLTSPPKKPKPKPDEKFIGKVIEYADRTVLVSVPFPDKWPAAGLVDIEISSFRLSQLVVRSR